MLRYAVVGAGAVGCFYGVRLAHAGADVQFLMRSGAGDVRAHGLDLTSPEGDIHLDDVVVAPDWAALQPCDVLIVAVKATANADVLAHLADHADRLLAPGSGILLAQNGIGVEPAYAAVAPGREVLGGLAFLCAQRTGPRRVAHLDFGALTIAAHAAGRRRWRDHAADASHRRGPHRRPYARAPRRGPRPCALAQAAVEHRVQPAVGDPRRDHRRAHGRPGHGRADPHPDDGGRGGFGR